MSLDEKFLLRKISSIPGIRDELEFDEIPEDIKKVIKLEDRFRDPREYAHTGPGGLYFCTNAVEYGPEAVARDRWGDKGEKFKWYAKRKENIEKFELNSFSENDLITRGLVIK